MFSLLKNALKKLPGCDEFLRWYEYKKRGKDYRSYVGGKWHEIGKLQFNFLVSQGLKPSHVFLDIACGSLRGGRFFIPYLDKGHYLGIDHNRWLIRSGLKEELPVGIKSQKNPLFVVSSKFEFNKFPLQPDYALALSLFTHLTRDDILICLSNLLTFMKPNGKFFATFNEYKQDNHYNNPNLSGDARHFTYSLEDMIQMGKETGWQSNYIGDWGHPRDQIMMEYFL